MKGTWCDTGAVIAPLSMLDEEQMGSPRRTWEGEIADVAFRDWRVVYTKAIFDRWRGVLQKGDVLFFSRRATCARLHTSEWQGWDLAGTLMGWDNEEALCDRHSSLDGAIRAALACPWGIVWLDRGYRGFVYATREGALYRPWDWELNRRIEAEQEWREREERHDHSRRDRDTGLRG